MAVKRKPAARLTRLRIGECEVGDVVRLGADYLVAFNLMQGMRWVRSVDPDTFREVSEPKFVDPDTEVEMVRRGVERYPKAMTGGEVDPLRREEP